MDKLQNEIRKLKNPSMVYFCWDPEQIPQSYLANGEEPLAAYCTYVKALLVRFKGLVPAVRFGFGSFALLGSNGLTALEELLQFARERAYYILLDAPEIWSPRQAELIAGQLMNRMNAWEFDGLLLPSYMGSDVLKPFSNQVKYADKDLFVVVRTANKSATEIQDLLTGSRLVYTAATDTAKRLGENLVGRSGYSRIGVVGPATSTEALATMRSKYPAVFILIDGFDYSGANAKNCASAFDNLGHGAIACVGDYVLSAWRDSDLYNPDPVELAAQAVERMKKNLNRYVTIL